MFMNSDIGTGFLYITINQIFHSSKCYQSTMVYFFQFPLLFVIKKGKRIKGAPIKARSLYGYCFLTKNLCL